MGEKVTRAIRALVLPLAASLVLLFAAALNGATETASCGGSVDGFELTALPDHSSAYDGGVLCNYTLRSADGHGSGMAITIEPGIYIEGWGGIRIEDTVLVTANGCEILTPTSKTLREI